MILEKSIATTPCEHRNCASPNALWYIEGISRARGVLRLVTLGDTEEWKKVYKVLQPAFIQAEKEGLLVKLQFD